MRDYSKYIQRKKFLYELERKAVRKKRKYEKLMKILKSKKIYSKRISCKKIVPPLKFDLRNNPEDVIKYFKLNKYSVKKGYGINFDLTEVEELTFDSIGLLLTKVKDITYTENVLIIGMLPRKPGLKKLFEDSGFPSHVGGYSSETSIEGKINGKMIKNSFTHKVLSELASDITYEIAEYSLPGMFKGNKFKPLYKILIECMANTENHAGYREEKNYNWWVFYYKLPGTKVTQVCFIDLGIGVIESMKTKWGAMLTELDGLGFFKNYEKLLKILKGDIKVPSRTKEKKRGKGLLEIYDFSRNEFVKNFTIITNDVYLDLSNNKKMKLENHFRGTYYYWEIHAN